jgi:hypothetical protein
MARHVGSPLAQPRFDSQVCHYTRRDNALTVAEPGVRIRSGIGRGAVMAATGARTQAAQGAARLDLRALVAFFALAYHEPPPAHQHLGCLM